MQAFFWAAGNFFIAPLVLNGYAVDDFLLPAEKLSPTPLGFFQDRKPNKGGDSGAGSEVGPGFERGEIDPGKVWNSLTLKASFTNVWRLGTKGRTP